MSYPQAIIFDLDGTLADSVHDIAASMNAVLHDMGLPGFETSKYSKWIGGGSTAMVSEVAKVRGVNATKLLGLYLAHYKRNLTDQTLPFQGVSALLQTCAATGFPIALLSNKHNEMVHVLRDKLFAETPFLEIIGLSGLFPRKPDPAAALYIAEQIGVRPTDCLLVGDTVTDMATAKAAQMQSAAALWGYGVAKEIEQTQPDFLFDDPAQLETLILQWIRRQHTRTSTNSERREFSN